MSSPFILLVGLQGPLHLPLKFVYNSGVVLPLYNAYVNATIIIAYIEEL